MDYSPPGSSVHGILQARILEWGASPFSRGSSLPKGLNLGLLHCRQILYHLRKMRKGWVKEKNKRWCILWESRVKGETPDTSSATSPEPSQQTFSWQLNQQIWISLPFLEEGIMMNGVNKRLKWERSAKATQAHKWGNGPWLIKGRKKSWQDCQSWSPEPSKAPQYNCTILFLLNLFCIEGVAHLVKNASAMKETLIRFLGREDPLEKG